MVYFDDIEVGFTKCRGEVELTESEMVEFASYWDPQPFHVDAKAAEPLGGLSAAGCHLFCIASLLAQEFEPFAVIAGLGWELQFPNPARVGDRLKLSSRCADKRVSKSKPDRGIMTFDMEMTNQEDTPVMLMRSKLMVARRPSGDDV